MKTNHEIQAEAERLSRLGLQYHDEQRNVGPATVLAPRLLLSLPESHLTTRHVAEPESETIHHHRRQRHIDAVVERDVLHYRLMEQETETTGSGRRLRDGAPAIVMVSQSGFELLRASYEVIEEEQLAERLSPYTERSEDRDNVEPADDRTVGEVEEIMETSLLPPAARMRAKAEITEFVEGRLAASVFITRAIERQRACDDFHQRMEERHELKLTIGEP